MSVVLIVEDDAAILRGLKDSLRFEGYETLTATDGESGHRLASERKPALLILDLMLPKMSGLEICRRLREDGFAGKILMLTARSEETDCVLGLDLGADDYVTKPFSIRELLARVRALTRQFERSEAPSLPDEIRFDDVMVDFRRFEAFREGAPVELTRKEFGLLRVLAGKPGEPVTREDLLTSVWGYDNFPTTRTVDTHIASLRAKLEEHPAEPRRLITVHGVGYKLAL
jgi:DNA-binding response OmpR family regulator